MGIQLLLAVRHLETMGNREKRFCSGDWGKDESILPNQDADPNVVHTIQGQGNYILAATGLRRTYETAALLGKELGYQGGMLMLPEFRERFAGDLAGATFDEIQRLFPSVKVPSDLWGIRAPERGLEDIDHFLERIARGIEMVRSMEKTVVLITHAGSIKGIRAVLESNDRSPAEILQEPTPANGAIFIFDL